MISHNIINILIFTQWWKTLNESLELFSKANLIAEIDWKQNCKWNINATLVFNE